MKYALIKDGLVENLVEVDDKPRNADLDRYKKELKIFETLMEEYEAEMQKCIRQEKILYAELTAIRMESRATRQPINKEEAREVKERIADIAWPTRPNRPKVAHGPYVPPEGCTLVKAPEGCDIGWEYKNRKFINPQEDKELS